MVPAALSAVGETVETSMRHFCKIFQKTYEDFKSFSERTELDKPCCGYASNSLLQKWQSFTLKDIEVRIVWSSVKSEIHHQKGLDGHLRQLEGKRGVGTSYFNVSCPLCLFLEQKLGPVCKSQFPLCFLGLVSIVRRKLSSRHW